jgi:hypothetical protein
VEEINLKKNPTIRVLYFHQHKMGKKKEINKSRTQDQNQRFQGG